MLGDTFEDLVLVEAARDPAALRFVTGPGMSGRAGRFTRDDQGSSAAVAALFRQFDDIEVVRIEKGSVTIALDDPDRWPDLLLDVFDTVTSAFAPPRVAHTDRQHERAVGELGALDVSKGATAPDCSTRRARPTPRSGRSRSSGWNSSTPIWSRSRGRVRSTTRPGRCDAPRFGR
jgi:hypothetical protein